jgi:hypothetical protein
VSDDADTGPKQYVFNLGTPWETLIGARPATVPLTVFGPVAPAEPERPTRPRRVFVAYPYRLYNDTPDYRQVYVRVGKALDVTFVFADEKISNLHIVDKIRREIRDSAFGIYDISGWNPNVTLELGLAWGMNEKAFVAFDPSHTPEDEVPSDVRGYDRMQYTSLTELEQRLSSVVAQELPLPRTEEPQNQLDRWTGETVELLTQTNAGMTIGEIGRALNLTTNLAQIIIKPLVERGVVRREGRKRGTRYFIEPTATPTP